MAELLPTPTLRLSLACGSARSSRSIWLRNSAASRTMKTAGSPWPGTSTVLSPSSTTASTPMPSKHLIPPEVTPAQAAITYATEADLLNVALFGQTSKQWRDQNPKLDGNMRDHATIEQLLVLANIEGMNAEFIHMALPQSDRLKRLNQIAIRQMQTLSATAAVQQLGQPKESKP